MRRLAAVLALLLLPHNALAQTPAPIEAIPPGEDVIVPLPKGTPAPFDGQLYDNSTALRWANWLRQYKLRLRVDVQEQKDICRVRQDAAQQELRAERDKYNAVVKMYDRRILELKNDYEHPPWYRSPTFYIGAGVVSTLLVVVGGAYIWHAAN